MSTDATLPPELHRIAWELGVHPEQLEDQRARDTPATMAPTAVYGLRRAFELVGANLREMRHG